MVNVYRELLVVAQTSADPQRLGACDLPFGVTVAEVAGSTTVLAHLGSFRWRIGDRCYRHKGITARRRHGVCDVCSKKWLLGFPVIGAMVSHGEWCVVRLSECACFFLFCCGSVWSFSLNLSISTQGVPQKLGSLFLVILQSVLGEYPARAQSFPPIPVMA